MLARLPYAFRHKLYCCLSPADVLHYRLKSNVFDDIKDDDCCHQLDEANEALLDVLFGKTSNPVNFLLSHSISSLLKCKNCRKYRTRYTNKCYSSLQFMAASCDTTRLLVPKRVLRYLTFPTTFWKYLYYTSLSYDHGCLSQLLDYCNTTASRYVELDLDHFFRGLFWQEFNDLVRVHTRNFFDSREDLNLKIKPVLPILQDYLSTVEIMRLGSENSGSDDESDDNMPVIFSVIVYKMVSYVVLYNIVTCQQPRLKQIEVYGDSDVVNDILTNVVKLCTDRDQSPVCFSLPSTKSKLVLARPPAPYLLKGLSVSLQSTEGFIGADKLSALAGNIVAFQLHNLEKVTIDLNDGDNTTSEYCALLSVLTELLRQPQLQFMSVSVSPLPEACSMIEAFLFTETTHHQTLRVEHDELTDNDNDDSGPICKKMKMDHTQPLPASNGTFKTLDIGNSSHHLHAWLFSIPNLQLKELRTSKISLVPDNVGFPVTESMR